MKHLFIWGMALFFLSPINLFAAATSPPSGFGSHVTEHHEAVFCLQLAVIMILMWFAYGWCAKRNMPGIVGELLVGIILGPTLFMKVWPSVALHLFPTNVAQEVILEFFSKLGVILFMISIGFEIDPRRALAHAKPALWIGIGGVAIPLLLGTFSMVAFYHLRGTDLTPQALWLRSIFLGNTMAISSLVIVVRVMDHVGLKRGDLREIILCAYAVNDVVAWVIYSVIFQSAAGETPGWISVCFRIGLTLFALYALLRTGPPFVNALMQDIKRRFRTEGVIVAALVVPILGGLVTYQLGLTLYFGVFLSGILLNTCSLVTEDIRIRLTDMTQRIAVPIYFVTIGLQLDLTQSLDWVLAVILTIGSIWFKYIGAWLSAWLCGRPKSELRPLGVAFTPSGVNGIFFAGLAMQYAIVDQSALAAVVISALVSSVIIAPWFERASRGNIEPISLQLRDLLLDKANPLGRIPDSVRSRSTIVPYLCRLISGQLHQDGFKGTPQELEESLNANAITLQESEFWELGVACLHIDVPNLRTPALVGFFWTGSLIQWSTPQATSDQITKGQRGWGRFLLTLVRSLFTPQSTTGELPPSRSEPVRLIVVYIRSEDEEDSTPILTPLSKLLFELQRRFDFIGHDRERSGGDNADLRECIPPNDTSEVPRARVRSAITKLLQESSCP